MKYKTIEELIDLIDRPIKTKIYDTYQKYKSEIITAKGSQYNHQTWEGGYIDHITETMNIAHMLYTSMSMKRQLEFSLSDALVVLFLHDIEKLFPNRIEENYLYFDRPRAKRKVRYRFLHEENIWDHLSNIHKNAIDTAEGEGDSYTNERRVMLPLGAFVHICDVVSSRIWFDHPLAERESWGWRESGAQGEQELWGV